MTGNLGQSETGRADSGAVAEAVLRYVLEEFRGKTGIDLRLDDGALCKVRERCQKAVVELKRCGVANVSVPFLVFDGADPVHLDVTVTREDIATRVER